MSLWNKNLLVREFDSSNNSVTWKVSKRAGLDRAKKYPSLERACVVFNWMETFCKIRDKGGNLVTFRMNPAQQRMAQVVATCWFLNIPVEIALPKSRQQGSSTFWQLLLLAMCILFPGYKAGLVAPIEESFRPIFGKTKLAIDSLKASGWGAEAFEERQANYLKWASPGPGFAQSEFSCAPIRRGDQLGKGDTPSGIHYSEAANFCDKGIDAHNAHVSIQESIPDVLPWKRIQVWESTANGHDPYFYALCERARDPNSGSSVILLFLPWFLTPEYSMTWADYRRRMLAAGKADPGHRFRPTQEEKRLRETLANQTVHPHEALYRYRVDLSDSQLIWRRWKIDQMNGDADKFRRYYPSFYEECFTASTSSLFDAESVDYYRSIACEASERGRMIDGMFARDDTGKVKIWKQPNLFEEYVLAADVGGSKVTSDPCSAYVVGKHSLEVVASIHGHFEFDEFADQVVQLANYYNEAYLVIENNNRPTVAVLAHRANYRNLHYHYDKDKRRAAFGPTPGWTTTRGNREFILKKLRRFILRREVDIKDPEFWKEMETFVWVPKPSSDNPDRDGVYKATGTNHDDRILALAMALYFCEAPEVKETELPGEEPSRALAFFNRMQKQEAREAKALAGDYLNLGANRG